MSVSYDEVLESSYAVIFPGPRIARTVEVIPGRVNFDFDDEGRLLAIEVMGVNQPMPELEKLHV